MNEFDFEGVFDEDYLYFYEQILARAHDRGRRADRRAARARGRRRDPRLPVRARPHRERARGARLPRHRHRRERALPRPRARRRGRRGASRSSTCRATCASCRGGVASTRVVNWFTSFGYFSDEQNKAVLRAVPRRPAPGGTLVLETQNITRILLQPRPQHWLERDGDLMVDEWKLDVENARFVTERIVVRGGSDAEDALRRSLVQRSGAARVARGSRLRERADARARAGDAAPGRGGPTGRALGSPLPQSDVRGVT